MRTYLSNFFYVIAIILLAACSKDPNEPNGVGNNNENNNSSPCDNITCLNGGTCINGICDCPDGYTGPDCGQLDLNVSIRINLITISGYPQTNGGSAWDDPFFGSSSTADIYYRIIRPSGAVFNSLTYFENVLGGPVTFNSSSGLPFIIPANDIDNSHIFRVMDLDDIDASDFGSSDDVMVSLTFTPENFIDGPSNPFPSTISLSNGSTTILLAVTYQW